MIGHTTRLDLIRQYERNRGERWFVSAHIRPGEYVATYAIDRAAAQAAADKFRSRNNYQIRIVAPAK